MPDKLKLYALPHSYYSGKVRSYLRYKRIPFEEVVTTLWTFSRFILPRTGVRFIPVIQTPDDVVVQDTTDIIEFLEQRHPERSIHPPTPRQHLVSLLFELYGDEWLLLPAMHYRWSVLHDTAHRNNVLEHFGLLLSPRAPRWLRRWFGWRLCQPFMNSLPMLGITDRTKPRIEAWYEEFLGQMNEHFARYPYLLGARASMGDFGLMGPLFAHLARDPYPLRLMRERAPQVHAWVQRMNAAPTTDGEWIANDEIPETLLPVLRRMFAEHFPVLLDTVQRLEQWLAQNPDRKIRRAIGWHPFRLGGVEERRMVFPYSQWMLQRPLDYFRSLHDADRNSVDALLKSVGGYESMQVRIARPVKRVNNRLVAAAPDFVSPR